MREILMSINPRWVSLIFDGLKTIELRKTSPKIEEPYKVYVYETKGMLEEPWMDEDGHMIWRGSGMVVGEFVCNRIYRIDCDSNGIFDRYSVDLFDLHVHEYLDLFPDSPFAPMSKTCVTKSEFWEYASGKQLYGWAIEEPKRYANPWELSDRGIKRPPQSWQYL